MRNRSMIRRLDGARGAVALGHPPGGHGVPEALLDDPLSGTPANLARAVADLAVSSTTQSACLTSKNCGNLATT
jgi:hypothetical protein